MYTNKFRLNWDDSHKTDYNYEIDTDESIHHNGRQLCRLICARDFRNGTRIVRQGDKGGWIQGFWNLRGDGWIFDNAKVYDDAFVYGDACVADNAEVFGTAVVYGNAIVSGNAKVYDAAYVRGQSKIDENSQVCGTATVSGDAWIRGSATLNSGDYSYGVITKDPG